jgi:hypothetical protein
MNYLLALHISKDLDRIRKRKKYFESFESFEEKDVKILNDKEKDVKVLNDKLITNDNFMKHQWPWLL